MALSKRVLQFGAAVGTVAMLSGCGRNSVSSQIAHVDTPNGAKTTVTVNNGGKQAAVTGKGTIKATASVGKDQNPNLVGMFLNTYDKNPRLGRIQNGPHYGGPFYNGDRSIWDGGDTVVHFGRTGTSGTFTVKGCFNHMTGDAMARAAIAPQGEGWVLTSSQVSGQNRQVSGDFINVFGAKPINQVNIHVVSDCSRDDKGGSDGDKPTPPTTETPAVGGCQSGCPGVDPGRGEDNGVDSPVGGDPSRDDNGGNDPSRDRDSTATQAGADEGNKAEQNNSQTNSTTSTSETPAGGGETPAGGGETPAGGGNNPGRGDGPGADPSPGFQLRLIQNLLENGAFRPVFLLVKKT
jgi:hypothetical protein